MSIIPKNEYFEEKNQKKQDFKETFSEISKENISIGYANNSLLESYSAKNDKNLYFTMKKKNGKQENINNAFDKKTLQLYLQAHDRFPEKYRLFIWKNLLQLPENKEAFNNLIKRGIIEEFHDLYKKFQLNSESLFRKLQRITSALVVYSPVLIKVPFLHDLTFPLIKLFSFNELWCFETILSFFLNWFQHFFEYSPNPPIHYFKNIDEILKIYSLDLWNFMQNSQISSIFLLWPSIQVFFTDILEKNAWFSLMDFLILNHDQPELFLYFCCSILVYYKRQIMEKTINLTEIFDKNSIEITKIIALAQKIAKTIPNNVISLNFEKNIPLIKSQYPIHDFSPRFDLDEHRKLREKIVKEEEQWLKDKNRTNISKLKNLTEKFLQNQDNLKENFQEFSKKLDDETELLKIQQDLFLRNKNSIEETENREKLKRIEEMENQLKKDLKHAISIRENEKEMIFKGLENNKNYTDMRIANKFRDESLNKVQFQGVMKLNEMIKQREDEILQQKNQQNVNYYENENFLRSCIEQEKYKTEKTLIDLTQELMKKKEEVLQFHQEELLKKQTNENNLKLKQMQEELSKTHARKLRELQLELEKSRGFTRGFMSLQQNFMQNEEEPAEKDQDMEAIKEKFRQEMLFQSNEK